MAGAEQLFDLTDRVAVVTGGAGILGPRHVEALAAHGAHVVLADLDEAACQAAATRLGPRVSGAAVDVTQRSSVEGLLRQVLDRWGRLDVLVNNAATKSPHFFAPLHEFPREDWDAVMAVNLTGVFVCCQVLGHWMAEHGAGSVINVASIYGVVAPDPGLYEGSEYLGRPINTPAVYAASKAGVLGLTRYLAAYWGRQGVRVNAVTPGGVESGQNEAFRTNYARRTPLGRMAAADEMQGALVYLASDASRYVTGHNLVVDGGWTAW